MKSGENVAVFRDNQTTVSWVDKLASKISVVAGKLLRAFPIRLKMKRASPLTKFHIAGKHNAMSDIPPRSFGSCPKWNCKTDSDILFLFNKFLSLPNKAYWTMFHPTKEISMKLLSVLRMEVTKMEDWN